MDLLKLKTWSTDEILGTVEEGLTIKGQPGRYADMLEGKTLAMLFQKTSTRTRVSFEVGMHQLGGQAVFLDWSATNFGLADLAEKLSANFFNFSCVLGWFFHSCLVRCPFWQSCGLSLCQVD